MTTDADEAAVDPLGEEIHRNSWSANLEGPDHADDRSLVVEEAVEAVARTAPGYHVNLVTHGGHGHPSSYLYPALDDCEGVDYEFVDRCGCGGYVTRVHVEE